MANNVVNPLGSPTTNFGWTKPTVGGDPDVWGGYINADLDGIDTAMFSMLPKAGGVMTGALTPSQTAGIVGTTTNNNAAAGAVGEYVVGNQLTNVSMANNANVNIVSISLTAGDWDVWGNAQVGFSAGGTIAAAWVSTASATFPPSGYAALAQVGGSASQLGARTDDRHGPHPDHPPTTTVYLEASGNFSTGTCAGQGTIQARRRR